MARLPRLVIAGLPHLVIHRGLNRQPVFIDDADRRSYLEALGAAVSESGVALHGYGLLADEVRLLTTPADPSALATLMQSIGRRHVRAFNRRHQRMGTPWEGRFRSSVIEPGAGVLACLRYVEETGTGGTSLASAIADPRWSSVTHHLGSRMDALITEHAAFWALGNTPFEREAAYRRLMDEPVLVATQSAMREAALKGWAWGSSAFIDALGGQTDRRVRPMKRGRPPKAGMASI